MLALDIVPIFQEFKPLSPNLSLKLNLEKDETLKSV